MYKTITRASTEESNTGQCYNDKIEINSKIHRHASLFLFIAFRHKLTRTQCLWKCHEIAFDLNFCLFLFFVVLNFWHNSNERSQWNDR